MSARRIAHVTFSSNGGAGSVAQTLQEAQVQSGHQSSVISLSNRSLRQDLLRLPLTAVTSAVDNFVLRKGQYELTSHYRRDLSQKGDLLLETEVLHFHWPWGVLSRQEIQCLNQPIIWTLHDFSPFTAFCHFPDGCAGFENNCSKCPQVKRLFQRQSTSWHAIQSKTLREKDNLWFVAPSQWMASAARSSSILSGLDVEVISNPVRHSLIDVRRTSRKFARETLGINRTDFVVGVVAQDLSSRRKSVGKIMEFLGSASIPRIFVCLIGPNTVDRFDSVPSAFFSPQSDQDLARTYSALDCVISSGEESFGLTLAEGAIFGARPYVLGRMTGQGDILNKLDLPEISSPSRLRESLISLQHEISRSENVEPARARLAKKARHLFSPETAARSYESVYERAMTS